MARNKLLRYSGMTFVAAAALFLGGCRDALLNPAGPVAETEKQVILVALVLMLRVVVPVFILTIVFAIRYRASNTSARYEPDWAHNKKLEVIWWAIPCVIILVLAIITWITSHTLDPYRPIKSDKKPLMIQVVSLDWKWLFIYPQQNIATVNYMRIPVGRPVTFRITSDAPMNGFWVPRLGGMIMAMPGMQSQLNLEASKAGVYKGFSGNFSGGGFSHMGFNVEATPEEGFDEWVSKVQRSPLTLTKQVYQALAKPSKGSSVQYYSGVADHLFSGIIMHYMMPAGSGTHMHMPPSQDTKTRAQPAPEGDTGAGQEVH